MAVPSAVTMRRMDILRLDGPLPDDLRDPVLVMALDGWTDAGQGGSTAAEELRTQLGGTRLGAFDPDRLFDYRDRRPLLDIDRGRLGEAEWPALELHWCRPSAGPDLLVVVGGEPDLAWQTVCRDLGELAQSTGAHRYVGLGSVPGPVPHTRAVRLLTTSDDDQLQERYGRPHERVIVPASFQVIVEAALRDAGLTTLGLWARVPHYVASPYPEASKVLLQALTTELELDLDTEVFDDEIAEHREKLDTAAEGSPEVTAHIQALEEAYDQDLADEGAITGPLPTGDQIAAELERFLKEQGDG